MFKSRWLSALLACMAWMALPVFANQPPLWCEAKVGNTFAGGCDRYWPTRAEAVIQLLQEKLDSWNANRGPDNTAGTWTAEVTVPAWLGSNQIQGSRPFHYFSNYLQLWFNDGLSTYIAPVCPPDPVSGVRPVPGGYVEAMACDGSVVDIYRNAKPDNHSTPPSCGFGNPIYPLKGEKREVLFTGWSVKNQPLTLTYVSSRKFIADNSTQSFDDLPSFGSLWFSSLHRKLVVNPSLTDFKVYRGNGLVSNFWAKGGVLVGESDTSDSLTAISGGYRFTDAVTKNIETYNSGGQLNSVTDSAGNVLTFTYSTGGSGIAPAAGYLTQVLDNSGRSIRFEYVLPTGGVAATDGLVSKIINSTGQAITVAYDANRNLAVLQWEDGKSRHFVYENLALPWALTGVVDENNSRLSTFGYDSAGRAISTERAGGVNRYSANYDSPPGVVVTEVYDANARITYRYHDWVAPTGTSMSAPNGRTIGLSASVTLGVPLMNGMSQPAGSGCAASNIASTFDSAGNLLSRDDFHGDRTCYAYDGANLETVRVEGLANTVDCSAVTLLGATLPTGARKITTVWHPDWRLPVKIEQPGSSSSTIYHGQPDPFNGGAVANCTPASNLPNGKPIPLVCKQVGQATLDAQGEQSDSSFGSVALLLHGDGPNGSTAFTDSSGFSRLVTASGTAKISTAQFKYGGSSVYFDGSASCLSSAAANNWSLGTGDFTVELWYRPTALKSTRLVTSRLTQGGAAGTWGFNVGATGISFTEVVAGEPGVSASFGFSTEVWYHLAASRSSGMLRLFVDGVQVASAVNTTNFSNTSYPLSIGCSPSENYLQGYIDDLRITKGVARYAANFVPSGSPFGGGNIDTSVPNQVTSYTYDTAGRVLTAKDTLNRITSYSYYTDTAFSDNPPGSYDPDVDLVVLLLHGNGTNGSTTIVDSEGTPKSVAAIGNAQISTVQSVFGGSSMAFDGVGDYLSVPYSPDFNFGSGDFTIETFLYKNANNANWSRIWSPNGDYYDGVAGYIDPNGNFGAFISTNGTSWNYSLPAVANLANGQWYHLAITRSGGSIFAFVNGVKYTVTAALGTTALFSNANYPRVIGGQSGVDRALNGYIDEFRITKGKARYTANFTPPTQEFLSNGLVRSPSSIGHTTGDLQSITNPAGHVTQFTQYDMAGRIRQMIDPKGVVTDLSYTPRGWVSTVTTTAPGGAGRTTTYSYDGVGQLTGVTQPDGTTLSYSYDAAHRLVGVTDAKGNSVNYTLDNVGNRIGEDIKDPTGTLHRSISRSFDALNRLQQVTGAER